VKLKGDDKDTNHPPENQNRNAVIRKSPPQIGHLNATWNNTQDGPKSDNAEGGGAEGKGERMKTYKTETRMVQTVDQVYCNKCGRPMINSNGHCGEGTTVEASFGYGSNKDGLVESWSLCDSCYDALIVSFIHKPEELENCSFIS
jgi:hypothetical protein